MVGTVPEAPAGQGWRRCGRHLGANDLRRIFGFARHVSIGGGMRRRFSGVGVALALAGLLCACSRVVSAPAAGQRHPWTIPDTLRIAIAASPKTLNPILSTTTNESIAETFILDPLIATDPEGRDRPILAATVPTLENAGISKDGLTIVYHLRKNVRWHDGAPFTSHDVKFTVAAIMNPETPVSTRHGYDL